MDPREYLPAYLEHEYLKSHSGLTPAALELLHEEIERNPAKYATSDHARALLSYAQAHERLLRELDRMEDLPDEEFEKRREKLFCEARKTLHKIGSEDRLAVDARLVEILLADVPLDACLNDLMKLEGGVHTCLTAHPAFDDEAPHYWTETAQSEGIDAATLTRVDPTMIGWLHTLEAISQLSLASARYRAAIDYARRVMRSRGYTNRAVGTVLLALARLEDEEAFFKTAHEADGAAEGPIEDSPWFLRRPSL